MPRQTRLLASALVGILAGCSPGYRWEKCETLRCRSATVEGAYEKDPEGVVAVVLGLEDPMIQAALVEQLAIAYPESKARLCGGVSEDSLAGTRCEKLDLRPHLSLRTSTAPGAAPAGRRQGAGPATSLLPRAQVGPTWRRGADEAALRSKCGEDPGCLSGMALVDAQNGRAVEAGQRCELAWPEGSAARAECLFRAAERLAGFFGLEHIETAVAMCGRADVFESSCVQHVLVEAMPPATPADEPNATDVQAMVDDAARLRATFGEGVGDRYAEFTWSMWTRESFELAGDVTGDLAALLPPETAAHLRAAAAYKTVQTWGISAGLEQTATWIQARLFQASGATSGKQRTRKPGLRITTAQPRAFWLVDQGGEGRLDATYCLGAGRRAVAEDALDDLRIAVLEAAARIQPPPEPRFYHALVGSQYSEVVRWTAARLASDLYGQGVSQPPRASDASALVQPYLR